MSSKKHEEHAKAIKALGSPLEWTRKAIKKPKGQLTLPGMSGLFLPEHCPECNGNGGKNGRHCNRCKGWGYVPSGVGTRWVSGEVDSGDGGRDKPQDVHGGGGIKVHREVQECIPYGEGFQDAIDPFEDY